MTVWISYHQSIANASRMRSRQAMAPRPEVLRLPGRREGLGDARDGMKIGPLGKLSRGYQKLDPERRSFALLPQRSMNARNRGALKQLLSDIRFMPTGFLRSGPQRSRERSRCAWTLRRLRACGPVRSWRGQS